MISKNKLAIFLLVLSLIAISSVSMVSATIYGGAFSTGDGLDDLTYASIDVGAGESGNNVIVQIWYSRDGSTLNHGNMVPLTVNSKGFINIRSADSYKYFPDYAEINIYDEDYNLLDSQEVELSPSKGIQTFGDNDYDHSYIKGKEPNKKSKSKSKSGSTSASANPLSGKSGTNNMQFTTSYNFFFS